MKKGGSIITNGEKGRIRINFIRYTIIDLKKKIVFQNHWVTDFEITKNNIEKLVSAGRCRWKAENECFNVLKNQGYCLEHSYGHRKDNLCFNFYLMTLLVFFVHQIFELTDLIYQAARKKFGSKKHMWETLRAYIKIIVFDSWEATTAPAGPPVTAPTMAPIVVPKTAAVRTLKNFAEPWTSSTSLMLNTLMSYEETIMKDDFPTWFKKILVTILYCLIFAGGLFYIDMLSNPTMANFKKILWSIVLGIGFSYINGFKFEIKKINKRMEK